MRIIALAALTLLLTGCVAADPVVTPVPVPSTTPLFATDADALKAAEDAYAAYLKVSDQIAADGGENPGRIDDVAVGAARRDDKISFAKYLAEGYRATGASTFDQVVLESYSPNSGNVSVVRIYLCLDVSGTDVIDVAGKSVISPNRVTVAPFEVGFDAPKDALTLKVSSQDVWTGKDFCK